MWPLPRARRLGSMRLPSQTWPTISDKPVAAGSCLWLLPITPEEVDFKKPHGTEALERRFEASAFNYANPWRPSIV